MRNTRFKSHPSKGDHPHSYKIFSGVTVQGSSGSTSTISAIYPLRIKPRLAILCKVWLERGTFFQLFFRQRSFQAEKNQTWQPRMLNERTAGRATGIMIFPSPFQMRGMIGCDEVQILLFIRPANRPSRSFKPDGRIPFDQRSEILIITIINQRWWMQPHRDHFRGQRNVILQQIEFPYCW